MTSGRNSRPISGSQRIAEADGTVDPARLVRGYVTTKRGQSQDETSEKD
jgi:hypothetical protein